MSINRQDSFGTRMKRYESVTQNTLMTRTPVIIRVDGKNFSKLTHSMEKPFDGKMKLCMDNVTRRLAREAQNCRLAYHQSDEVSLLLTDFKSINSEPWFGNEVQKIVSVSAAIATAAFIEQYIQVFPDAISKGNFPVFDARCFNVPREDVKNYFVWRQRDCERNSVSMCAQSKFSQKQLDKMNRVEMIDMMKLYGINWSETIHHFKYGSIATKEKVVNSINEVIKSRWALADAPLFTQDKLIEQFMKDEEDKS